MIVQFLGTGTSHGIPVIGCLCDVCTSPNSKNKRRRTGVILQKGDENLAIDISPEFRLAAIEIGLRTLDTVLLTHGHNDHIGGLDDLRIFTQRSGSSLPIYANKQTLSEVRTRFDYAFGETKSYGGGVPSFSLHPISRPRQCGSFNVVPLPVMHGPQAILGFRIEKFAFITDVTRIPPTTFKKLQSLDVLVLDCLRRTAHTTHLSLGEAVLLATRIGAKQTYFTHMCHDLEHEKTESVLPVHIRLAYDGLKLKIPS